MKKPLIADTKPKSVALDKGEYHWCGCGRSGNQPFCDGSHRGTGLSPTAFTMNQSGDAVLCMCKRTQNPPYCDGTHASLTEEEKKAYQAKAPSGKGQAPAPKDTPEEPYLEFTHQLAKEGLEKMGSEGPMGAMGVPREQLPTWNDIQILTAQLATRPLMEEVGVETELVIGPKAKKPLRLSLPIFVSDMSFGSLSEEAKTALAKGAELAGTGICSGEGGMLPEEQAENSKYFYELASAKFGFHEELLTKVQAFHFKAGQAAKTGIGGHLPGKKVTEKIAKVRHLTPGEPAVSPPAFSDLVTPKDFKKFSDRVREISGGIPIGIKMSANHIEEDLGFALQVGVDYIILDGRGGGTGAAPLIFRNNISVPTIPALARARRYLNKNGGEEITLIITGGLRTPADFVKALCLGADGIAIANSAIHAIGCVAARICNTNNCPSGVATQQEELRARLKVDQSAQQLARYLDGIKKLMQAMAKACGHEKLNQFSTKDITTWKKEMSELAGISFSGGSKD